MLEPIGQRLAAHIDDMDVADALDMAQALLRQRESVRNTLYVLPDDEAPEPNRMSDGSVLQVVTARALIVIAVRSRRQGEQAQLLGDWQRQVHDALLGWTPPGHRVALSYAGGNLINLDDGVVWYGQRYQSERLLQSHPT